MKTKFLLIISVFIMTSCYAQEKSKNTEILMNNNYVYITESQLQDSTYVWTVTYCKMDSSVYNQQTDKQLAFINYIAYLEDIVE